MSRDSEKKIKLILVDDNDKFRTVLKQFIQNEFGYNIIGEASCSKEFFELKIICQANIILMDLLMPDMDGYAITKKIMNEFRELKIIAITMHTEKAYLMELIKVGFKGCVFKPDIFKNLNEAIENVTNNKLYFPKDIKM